MKQYIQNFKKFQPLMEELVARDIKIKYRRSVLGVLWTLLNPLLMMIVLSVVFSNLFKFDVENFPLFILSGTCLFQGTDRSVSMVHTLLSEDIPEQSMLSLIFSTYTQTFPSYSHVL